MIQPVKTKPSNYSQLANKTIGYRGLEQSAGENIVVNNQLIQIYHKRLVTVGNEDFGKQPIHVFDKVMLFNGAIYNYVELAEKYGINSNNSDTEVLKGLVEHEAFNTNVLDGMYAICIIDKSTSELQLYRDRFGEKPLYYSVSPRKIVVSSSLHFVRIANGDNKIKHKSINRSIAIGPICDDPNTEFETVRTVIPGSCVKINYEKQVITKNGSESKRPIRTIDSEAETIILDALLNSVEKRTRGQHKYCVGLSGGLDSSVLAACLRHIYPNREIYTVSNIYPQTDSSIDESELIKSTGKALNLSQIFIEPDLDFVITNLDKMLSVMDFCPFNTCMSGWATYAAMQKYGFRVSIEGQGADEVFAGYTPYFTHYLSDKPNIAELLKTSIMLRNAISREDYYFVFGKAIAGFLIKKFQLNKYASHFDHKVERAIRHVSLDLESVLHQDQNRNLRLLLSYGDKSSMFFNIEQRFPYLCSNVVDTVNSTKIDRLINCRGTKQVLRSIAIKLGVPEEIVFRKKKLGWPIPEKIWMQEGLEKYMEHDLVKAKAPLLNKFIAEKQFAQKIRIYMITKWMEIHGVEVKYEN